jgi:hypothetical protein
MKLLILFLFTFIINFNQIYCNSINDTLTSNNTSNTLVTLSIVVGVGLLSFGIYKIYKWYTNIPPTNPPTNPPINTDSSINVSSTNPSNNLTSSTIELNTDHTDIYDVISDSNIVDIVTNSSSLNVNNQLVDIQESILSTTNPILVRLSELFNTMPTDENFHTVSNQMYQTTYDPEMFYTLYQTFDNNATNICVDEVANFQMLDYIFDHDLFHGESSKEFLSNYLDNMIKLMEFTQNLIKSYQEGHGSLSYNFDSFYWLQVLLNNVYSIHNFMYNLALENDFLSDEVLDKFNYIDSNIIYLISQLNLVLLGLI